MAKRRSPSNQLAPDKPKDLPEYSELITSMQNETASVLSDYVREWVGSVPGGGIFLNKDRVLGSQTYLDLAWYDLYAEVERDPHISAVLNSAKINVACMKWDVVAHLNGKEKKPSTRNQAIADFIKDCLASSGPTDDEEGMVYVFPQHLHDLMGALGMGFAVSEVLYNAPDPSRGVTIKNILNRPQRRFQFDVNDRTLKLRTLAAPYFGEPLPKKKFIVHRCSSQWANPFGDALDQSLYWMWLFKKTVLKFWMQHLQVGASSIPIVEHPASANKELKAEALSIAQMIRNGAYGRVPDSFKIIWAEAKNAITNAEAYQMFVRTVNDEISKCINGQTLTAEASSMVGTGSRALGAIHQVTQNQRDVFRSSGLAATLNATLVRWLVDFNFSNVEGYPQFKFDSGEADDLVKESEIVKNLSGCGYDFSEAELSEKFGYEITKKAAPKVPAIPLIKPGAPIVAPPEEPKETENVPV